MIIETDDGSTINTHRPDEQEYTVVWECEISAKSSREAAEIARQMHRDPESTANVFYVTYEERSGRKVTEVIDLDKEV